MSWEWWDSLDQGARDGVKVALICAGAALLLAAIYTLLGWGDNDK